jgi:hypothetical protein
MNSTLDGPAGERNGYRVEVSGWDAKESLFVEKATLAWTESAGKTAALKVSIRIGGVLFVRLIQRLEGGSSFPVPYRAADVSAGDGNSHGVITVEQLQPRMAFRESATRFADSTSNLR